MSKLRTWRFLLYVALLSFNYVSGFTCLWLSGGDVFSMLLHVESLATAIFGPPLQSVVIWYLIVKTIEHLNTYLPVSQGKRVG